MTVSIPAPRLRRWLGLIVALLPALILTTAVGCSSSRPRSASDDGGAPDAPDAATPDDDDDDAGPDAPGDDDDAGPDPCVDDDDCDDGVFCNGVEFCRDGACLPGRRPGCDDRSICTIDSCDLDLDRCVHPDRDDDEDGEPRVACGGLDCDDDRDDVGPGATEDCANGRDDDCDGSLDCTDPACTGDPACDRCDLVDAEEDCADGRDEDCDGLVDCDDVDDCGIDEACCDPRPETCMNGVDADCDGLELCDDPDCAADPFCADG